MKPFVSILTIGLIFNIVSASNVVESADEECDSSGEEPQVCKGAHEVWTKCGNNSCVKSCASLGLTNVACRPSCGSGCICVDGYFRNAKGICVKPQDCGINICPGKNETYSACVSSCAEKCVTLGRTVEERGCETPQCTPGCDCKAGFFRNTKNVCVTPDKCECGVNEEFSKFGRPCPSDSCSSIGTAAFTTCSAYDPKNPPPPSCNCKLNFYRFDGVCIDIRECPPNLECPELTEYDPCPDYCEDQRCYKIVSKPSNCEEQETNKTCNPSCRCSEGNCEDELGTCVDRDTFVPKCPAANEVYSSCGINGCTKTCATFGITISCAAYCGAGCSCDIGFVRETTGGKCIPILDCKENVCPGKNMEFSPCASDCIESCSNLGQNRTCNPTACGPACVCKPGFFANTEGGECVTADKCVCLPDQVLDLCSYPCPPETCATIGALFRCARDKPCAPACKCQLNFKRDSHGNCIDIRNCRSPTCWCKLDFKRDRNGDCIDTRECSPPFECPLPSVYDACKPHCADERCVKDGPLGCEGVQLAEPLLCRPYCRCPAGTCRTDAGLCVDDIPFQTCNGDVNAMFSACGDPCPRTCANSNDPVASCLDSCIKGGGCKCKPGFVRNFELKCIRVSECEKCGVNEFFDCGSACDTTCATLGERCTTINKTCNKKCYCKEGFARDAKNVCIPVKQCPAKPCQGDVNANPADGCKCRSGFVKDKVGKCVEQPILKCGANEKVDNCALCKDQTCAMVFAGEAAGCTKPPGCPVACRCLPGFVRGLGNQCVKPGQCCIDPNSELVSSPSPCPGGTCECPTVAQCKDKVPPKGCRCKAGFLKNSASDATCVDRKNCPKKAAH